MNLKDTQNTESISSAIQETILPSLQKSFSGLNSGLGTNVDSRSSRLSRNIEGKKHRRAWGNTQNSIQIISNNLPYSRENSLSSLDCRDDHDMVTGANTTPHMVPGCLTGRPIESREDPQRQDHINHASHDNSYNV